MELLEQILMIIGAVVSGATLIVLGLEKIAAVTPTTKDDEFVGKLQRGLGYVSAILDRFAVHPTKKQ